MFYDTEIVTKQLLTCLLDVFSVYYCKDVYRETVVIMSLKIKIKDICDILLSGQNKSVVNIMSYVEQNYNLNDDQLIQVERKLSHNFIADFKKKYKSTYHSKQRFYKKYKDWLSHDFTITFQENVKSHTTKMHCSAVGGRPKKLFEDYTERHKRRKVQEIRKQLSTEELKYISRSELKNSENQRNNGLIPYTADEALSLILDAKLSKYQYELIRLQAKARNACIYPSYKEIIDSKKKCYTPEASTNISEKGAEIDLQSLLDVTTTRLMESLDPDLSDNNENNEVSLTFIHKWGCDGSSGQSQYKQSFTEACISDNSIFMVSLVPLQLQNENNYILWKNPHPSSPKYCRPIKFEYTKETKDKIINEVDRVKEQIAKLNPTKFYKGTKVLCISHVLHLTMVDGKVCQALSKTPSSSSCYICGAKPSEMNSLDTVRQKEENKFTFEFGLSTLHAWIRFMECILHIAYRIGIQKWSARTESEKLSVKERKIQIQNEFRTKMGLNVDIPRQTYGSSNDGNTSRRFFQNYKLTSEITEINENLIRRFAIILQTLACGKLIDIPKFNQYAIKTAKLYISEYNWYPMPQSVHKILLHSKSVLEHMILPIGLLSEEAQESRNKDYKRFRLFHTRKSSRIINNTDILHHLLVSSDPYIGSKRRQWKTSHLEIDPEAEQLLINDSH